MRLLTPRLLSALLCLSLVFGSPLAASAQADTGQIIITISEATSKTPIPLARVLLDGPVMTSEYSGANGAVKFTDVPDGIYRARVFKGGYEAVTSETFEVSNGKAVSVVVALAKSTQLKEIGRIVVKSSATVTTSSLSDTSAQRRLSTTLADALNKISGVSVDTSSADSDATQTVSLQGQDASQTALSLDGIPLNAPGAAGNLNAIGTDLFRGSSVSFGPQSGGLAGGVNFRTLEPTLAWQGTASLSAGSYGRYNWSIGETGSLGKLGVALQHTSRTTPSLANGMRFLDASGLDYEHDAVNANTGDLLKLRYRLGASQTLTGTILHSVTNNGLLCLQITGALPCGYGPDNSNDSHFKLYSLSDSALIGSTAVQASIFQNSAKFDRNLLNRYLNGIPDPTGSLTDTRTQGFSVNALLPSKERHTISINANSMTTLSQNTPLIASALPYANGTRRSSYNSVSINDAIASSTKLKMNDRIGLSQTGNSPSSLLAGITASWSPTSSDDYTASYSLGGAAGRAGPPSNLSDPHSLRFDCNGNIAYGSAPGDEPAASSSTDARLSWQHKLKNGFINTSVYRQVQNGMLLGTQVNGSILGGIFPPGYVAAVQAQYDSPGGCNAGGAPFGVQNLYFSVPVGGVKRVYQGAQIAANLSLGNLNVQPYYDIAVAQAISGDPRINNAYSIITSGGQLPGTPLHRAGLTLDYKAPGSAVEGLFSARYVGKNNSQNLPAYTIVDAGLNAHLTHGDVTLAANNIFDAYGGIFATNVGAVPYPTQAGGFVPTIARPNAPREYSITYTVPFGLSARTAPTTNLASQVGGDGGRPHRGGRPGGFDLTPFPLAQPADPLALMTSNQACTPDAQKTIAPFLSQLKGYLAKIEANKTPSGYPNAVTGAPQAPGTTAVYHKVGSSYAVSLEIQRVSATQTTSARAFTGCVAVHLASPEDVQGKG
ncbi:MAG: TonB-dependent receptor, partial [Candidatus Eremiobacteraeota bacterium]|nr:TonB-dependent receptor [Candidatus Eremiobacteraeota bacterium]